jgi:hypothetical protein
MASSTTTNLFRSKIASWIVEQLEGAEAKFGDGGHNPETEDVLSADPDQTELNNPLIIKPIVLAESTDYDVRVLARLDPAELVGIEASEAGVFTAAGELVCLRNFGPKTKESDETYDQEFIIHF